MEKLKASEKETKGNGRGMGYVQLFPEKYADVKERFEAVSTHKDTKEQNAAKVGMAAIFLIMFLLSYAFVIQSEFEAPLEEIEEGGAYSLDITENYIIRNKDGTYTLSLPDGNSHGIDEETALKAQAAGFRIVEEGGELR